MAERTNESFEASWFRIDKWLTLFISLGAMVAIFLISQFNYLLFHSFAEAFSIVIASGIGMFAWNTRRYAADSFLQVIGVAYLGIAVIDFVHTLAYKGMGVFPGNEGSNLATQLWIIARYLESLALILATFYLNRKTDAWRFMVSILILVTVLMSLVFVFPVFPTCYREGVGLTPFKIISEYIICCLLLLAGMLLYHRRAHLDLGILVYFEISILITITSELCFTFYHDVYGILNVLGHLLKIVSFYLVYVATIQTGLERPVSMLFLNQKRNQDALEQARRDLETRVLERTAELQESEKRYRDLIETSPNAILLIDRNDKIQLANRRAATLTGYASAEDMIGRNVWNMQAPDKERITDGSILKRLMNSDLFALEFTVQRLDGTQVPVEVNLSSTKSADGKLVSYVLIAQDITQRKKLAEKEEKYRQDLRSLAMELSVSEEHERRRIAVGLHDGIGQSLALCRMKLGAIKSIPELAQKTQSIEQIDRLLADIIADTRSLIFELSPPILYELGLAPALTWLAEKTSAEYNLNISVIDNAHAMELPEDLRVFLFQATRELVHNVTKHAKADQVEIRLEVEDGCFNLRVFDNGSGLLKDQKPTKEGFGLFYIRERLRHLGGQLTMATGQGSGCAVTICIPWKEMASTV